MIPDYTVYLQVCDEEEVLYYHTYVCDDASEHIVGFEHSSENYNEALAYARAYFSELEKGRFIVACYIEQPGRFHGQGALYDVGRFAASPDEIVSDEQFYDLIIQEMLEQMSHNKRPHINVVFRRAVQKHKLDLFKENKLLYYLQKCDIVRNEDEEDAETWLKKQMQVQNDSE